MSPVASITAAEQESAKKCWISALRRANFNQLPASHLMADDAYEMFNRAIERYKCYWVTDSNFAKLDRMPPCAHAQLEELRDLRAAPEYNKIAPTLGPPLDGYGVDRVIAHMVAQASGPGGPVRMGVGGSLLGGDAGPDLVGTPTQRLLHLLLYHSDRDRVPQESDPQTLFERTRTPLQATWRTVGWVHQKLSGSEQTLNDSLRRSTVSGVIEQTHAKEGRLVRLKLAYTFQAAQDRAAWSELRDAGLLPIERVQRVAWHPRPPASEPKAPATEGGAA
jgi:hypothetical protein